MKQIFRYTLVLVMLFGSMTASAESTVKVMSTTHGKVTVDKTSASTGQTVKVTVTPSSGYYFQKSNLEVIKTVSPGVAQTRGDVNIPVATPIAVNGDDPADLSKARTYTFTVPGDGYELQVSAKFSARKSITSSMVSLSQTSFFYTGTNQKPSVSVTGLTENKDYTVTFKETSWKNVGTYSLSVNGISKYKGTVNETFTILETPKVALSKTTAAIEKGKTLTLTATVTPSALEDKSVTWTSSNKSVATVSSSGKVTGVKAGTATITCTSKTTGAKATCKVTIGYVTLDKTTATIEKGKTLTLKATVYPSDLSDKSVTWTSSDKSVATVSSSGKVTGVKAGTATITCTSKATSLKATCKVTVGYVKLDKTTANIEKGKTLTLKATVYPSDLSDKSVTWTTSDKKIATVSSSGKVTGVKAGTATITCTSKATGLKETCAVTVGYVSLDKTEVALEKGKTLTLKATVYPSSLKDKSVTWTTSDKKIATVSSAGKVTGVKAGTVTITCTSKATNLKATCKVTVGYVKLDKTEVRIKKGKTVTLKATVYPSDLKDKSVTWKSSNTKVATVTSAGKVKGIKAGTVTITCTSKATGLKETCKVIVSAVAGTRSMFDEDEDENEDEYDGTTGIEELELEERPAVEEGPYDVYDLSGRKVANQVTSLDGLPHGIYIVNGKKMLKR